MTAAKRRKPFAERSLRFLRAKLTATVVSQQPLDTLGTIARWRVYYTKITGICCLGTVCWEPTVRSRLQEHPPGNKRRDYEQKV